MSRRPSTAHAGLKPRVLSPPQVSLPDRPGVVVGASSTSLGSGPVSAFQPTDSHDGSVVDQTQVVRRPIEGSSNPDRLNLDRKRLTQCPVLEGQEALKLITYQSNAITRISNLANLPELVFLDLYNNKITHITGLEAVPQLRVLMLGKNRICDISGLDALQHLDVLDLHNNDITQLDGVAHLRELRVLNLAGNRIRELKGIFSLKALSELNLRRNLIEDIPQDVRALVSLQRLFLSANQLKSFASARAASTCTSLQELTLDGNPIATEPRYREAMLQQLPNLKHLDTKRVTDEERKGIRLPANPPVTHQAGEHDPPTHQSPSAASGVLPSPRMVERLRRSTAHSGTGGSGFSLPSATAAQPPSPATHADFVEYDAAKHLLRISGTGNTIEMQLRQLLDQPVVHGAQTLWVEGTRLPLLHRLAPLVQQLSKLATFDVSDNGIRYAGEWIEIGHMFSGAVRLTWSHNEFVSLHPNQAQLLCIAMFPHLTNFNGSDITANDRRAAAGVYHPLLTHFRYSFSHAFRLLCLSDVSEDGAKDDGRRSPARQQGYSAWPHLSPSVEPSDPGVRARAAAYVGQIVGHATNVDERIQTLGRNWDGVVERIVARTLQQLLDGGRAQQGGDGYA